MQRFEKWFFLLIIGFHLLYIWQQKYFLTADGPAHVYNSKVLLDIICGESEVFYRQYYDLNLKLFPNWFTHVSLASLLLVFSPVVAEKILLSFYVILFPLSVWFAVKQIAGKANLLMVLVFPFVFHFLVYYGFYNYSFSIPFAFLFVGCWKKLREASLLKQAFVLFPLAFLIFITHLFGWFIAGISLGGIFIIESITTLRQSSFRDWMKEFSQRWMAALLAGLISIGAALLFMQQNSAEMQYWPETPERLQEIFLRLEALVLWGTEREFLLVQWFVYLILFVLVILIINRIYRRQGIHASDAWLFGALIFIAIYFMQPRALFLGGFWTSRMSWIGWFFLVAWLSSFPLPVIVERTAAGIVIVLIALLAVERFPYQQRTSDALADYLSAVEKIPAQSTILPLSFSHHGMDENGNRLNNYRWQFQHAFDYCGAYKPVINYANYEATTTWFPLHWKQDCSPFEKYNRGRGIEAQPPDAHLSFTDNSSCNYTLEYVITWCMTFSDSNTGEWISVNRQLRESYSPIYESPTKRTVVWKKKTI